MKDTKPYPTEEELPLIETLNDIDFSASYTYAEPTKLLTIGEQVTTSLLPGFLLNLEEVFRD